ncbi:tRNA pseudouridine13 synthase [Trypanosoma theileri]|uniref:tRNA pseudouridine13 synthase n=1 Tax=Trypanosoma theileri TaxID=67003 RepID=A0A1X0NRV3_9TRYP|nr:tRNA pseudouridine13 synthase [Trypanosoma theileri]ORC87435.1 tRNA pseudouridine13 synthase [Trypanosoma theileri]
MCIDSMLEACGISGFLLPVGRAATASLKRNPEDFTVVEIDPAGVRTDAVGYQLPIPTPQKNGNNIDNSFSSLQEKSNTAVNTSGIDRKDYSLVSAGNDISSSSFPAECEVVLLNDVIRDALSTTFGSKQDAIAQYRLSICTDGENAFSSNTTKEFLIGVFNSREDRKRLHYTLKTQFPHLRTETRRIPSLSSSSLQGNGEMSDYQVFALYDLDYLLLAYCLDERTADAMERWNTTEPSCRSSFKLTANFSQEATKETRRCFHKMLSRRYPDIISRVTNGQVTLMPSPKQRGKRLRNSDNGNGMDSTTTTTTTILLFRHLLVRKRNLDMMELRILLAEYFNVPDTAVCSAGMKDKCAVTYQRCSVPISLKANQQENNNKKELIRLTWPSDPSSYLEILQISDPCKVPIQTGELNGNWFRIRLLDINGISQDELTERLRRIESDGFLNYFGQQRFSENVKSVRDHVGIHVLAGRWIDAVRSLMSGAPGLYESFPEKMEVRYVPMNARDAHCIVHALRRVYQTQYASLSNPLSSEDVKSYSSRWKQLCHDALLTVPYAFRVLWIHGAQSLIFNMMLSKLSNVETSLKCVKSLPLLGYQITVEDAVKPFLEPTLSELHLTVDDVFQQKKVLGVSLPGAMRETIVHPKETLLVFDSDKRGENGEVEKEREGEEKDSFNATLSFSLPSSSYATIFLREVLGCDKWWS